MQVVHDGVGALFAVTSDAVVIVEDGRVLLWNAPAEQLVAALTPAEPAPVGRAPAAGAPTDLAPTDLAPAAVRTPAEPTEVRAAGGAAVLQAHLPALLALDPAAPPTTLQLGTGRTVEATRRVVEGRDVLLLRDVTWIHRQSDGLRRLAALSRELLDGPPGLQPTLQSLVREAKAMTGADYSVLMLLREGTTTETTHFVYDAPRELFPERMPRFVGLLQVPLRTGRPARLDDMTGHPESLGLPAGHPPIGPLLSVPLIAGEALLGELAVGNDPHSRRFDELDESLLVDLAAHAAVAIRWAQAAEQSREQVRRRQEIVDAARHDIRTPLGAGKGYAALLASRLDRMSPTQVATALDGLRSSFDRIEAFTARLLVDDQLGQSPPALRWEHVDLVPMLAQVRRDAEAVTGRADAVVVHVSENGPTRVWGDAEQVREVIDNLVGNALKYAGAAGPVTVSVRSEGDQVRLDVRDLGPGIPEQEQSQLFERWSRTDASRAAALPGLGLGLSIVRRMVLSHGGTLGVSSRPGEGATFWVTFPAAPPTVEP